MSHEQTIADCIFEAVSRSPGCLLEELALDCPSLTWNQVFIEVDHMSRNGRLLLERKGPGIYIINLPATAPQPLVAPATFLGYLKLDHHRGLEQPVELWNLTAAIPGHPVNSTVTRQTLEKAGYVVPLPPLTVRSS